eukprot:GHVH01008827.1.p1 GENE.GHVH01008827.1~~GHVH01008827.1.p1  ORF type:complete len:190 (+),score=25.02 GHVH01008827.1:394-963(+)
MISTLVTHTGPSIDLGKMGIKGDAKDEPHELQNISASVKSLRFMRKLSGPESKKELSKQHKGATTLKDGSQWVLPEFAESKLNDEDKAIAEVRKSFGGVLESDVPKSYHPISEHEKGLSKVDYKKLIGGYVIYDQDLLPSPPLMYPARRVYNRSSGEQSIAAYRVKSIEETNLKIIQYHEKVQKRSSAK